jgi:hypothetical protein
MCAALDRLSTGWVLELAEATIERFVEQAIQLYEQRRRERVKAPLLGRLCATVEGMSAGWMGRRQEYRALHHRGGIFRRPRCIQDPSYFPSGLRILI